MSGSGTVQLMLFAGARECAGVGMIVLELTEATTVATLSEALLHRFPALNSVRDALRFAVNGSYATPETPVRAGDAVAVIPPAAVG